MARQEQNSSAAGTEDVVGDNPGTRTNYIFTAFMATMPDLKCPAICFMVSLQGSDGGDHHIAGNFDSSVQNQVL